MIYVLAAVLVLFVIGSLPRANRLCLIRLSSSGAELLGGRAPAQLLQDFGDIARRANLGEQRVAVHSEGGAPRLRARGLTDEGTAQRLRNVVGQYNVMQFRTGKRAP